MFKKVLVCIVVLFVVVCVSAHLAGAMEYPTKPIEIFCPYSPGGPADITARVIAETAQKFLGQPMVVVGKTGASGTLAAGEVARSKPDGYKLVILTNTFFSATVKTMKVPFKPSDLVPIAMFAEDLLGIVVRGDSEWKTINDLLDYGKKNPGKIKWAHTGRGNIQHIMTLLVFKKAGIETIEVPYKGVPEMLSALLGGHLDALSAPYASLQDHVKANKARYLLVHSNQRSSGLPNVPSAKEAGFTETADLSVYWSLYAHKDTPKEIMKTLFDAFKKTYEDPGFQKTLVGTGLVPKFGDSDFIKAAIRKGELITEPIYKQLGLYIEQ